MDPSVTFVAQTDTLVVIQIIGGILSILLTGGTVLAIVYSLVKDTPNFVRKFVGVDCIENKLDRLIKSQEEARRIDIQRAQEFNRLSELVCREHDLPEDERPHVNVDKLRRYFLGYEDFPRFTGEEEE